MSFVYLPNVDMFSCHHQKSTVVFLYTVNRGKSSLPDQEDHLYSNP